MNDSDKLIADLRAQLVQRDQALACQARALDRLTAMLCEEIEQPEPQTGYLNSRG